MSRVEAVLEALGVEIAREGRDRVWALCPVPGHDDRRPTSFFVRTSGHRTNAEGRRYSAAGQWWCFACQRGGSLVDLVVLARGIGAEEARAFLDARGAVADEPRSRVVHMRVVERPRPLARPAFRMPREVIQEPLSAWVSPAGIYAAERGITAEEVERYRIGYAVDGRLAGRIVFPWLGPRGVARGYSARSFAGEEPKYLTPHESELADRGTYFGEHLWPPPAARRGMAVLVAEGAINALAAARAWPSPIAALGGSDVDPIAAAKLATFGAVVLLTDPDPAGRRAAAKVRTMLGRHCMIAAVEIPMGLDAADLGCEDLRTRIGEAIRFVNPG